MLVVESVVGVRVKIASFRDLAYKVFSLPEKLRPTYFTVGERVRDKTTSRISDHARFSAFLNEHVANVSGFYLIGSRIRFGFFIGETRNAHHESTHVGCSVILRGRDWTDADLITLLRELSSIFGVDRAYACRRDEWERRHLYIKKLPQSSIQTTLGVDMCAALTGLYWWTIFSEELISRHQLNIIELATSAKKHERWLTTVGVPLHAFELYDSPDDWEEEDGRISAFLKSHLSFFSMARIQTGIDEVVTKEEFDSIARPFRAGAVPWEVSPPTAR